MGRRGHKSHHRRHHGIGSHRHHGIGHRHHGIGHRHHGFGHRHRSHFSMFHHRRRFGLHHRGHRSGGMSYEQTIQHMATYMPNPTIANGTYTHTSDQARIVTGLQQMVGQAAQMAQNGTPLHTVDITVVGNTAQAGSDVCYCLTLMCLCLIFPICFMCCDWWKKITYSKYEVDINTYDQICNAIRAVPSVTKVTLHVLDNGFNNQKATTLYNMVAGGQLRTFNFQNRVLAVNWRDNEVDNFQANMAPITQLGIDTLVAWDEQIFTSQNAIKAAEDEYQAQMARYNAEMAQYNQMVGAGMNGINPANGGGYDGTTGYGNETDPYPPSESHDYGYPNNNDQSNPYGGYPDTGYTGQL